MKKKKKDNLIPAQEKVFTRNGFELSITKNPLIPCEVNKMTINGVRATLIDFGQSRDIDEDNAPDFGCGKRVVLFKEYSNYFMGKFGINQKQHAEIVEILKSEFTFIQCSVCDDD